MKNKLLSVSDPAAISPSWANNAKNFSQLLLNREVSKVEIDLGRYGKFDSDVNHAEKDSQKVSCYRAEWEYVSTLIDLRGDESDVNESLATTYDSPADALVWCLERLKIAQQNDLWKDSASELIDKLEVRKISFLMRCVRNMAGYSVVTRNKMRIHLLIPFSKNPLKNMTQVSALRHELAHVIHASEMKRLGLLVEDGRKMYLNGAWHGPEFVGVLLKLWEMDHGIDAANYCARTYDSHGVEYTNGLFPKRGCGCTSVPDDLWKNCKCMTSRII